MQLKANPSFIEKWRNKAVTSVLAIATFLLLIGCDKRAYDFDVYCPPTLTYSDEFNDTLADELSQVGPETKTYKVIEDYANLRDLIKACERAAK